MSGTLCCDGEHGEYAEGDAGRDGLEVDPEGDPRQEDDQHAGKKRRKNVGSQTTLEVKVCP